MILLPIKNPMVITETMHIIILHWFNMTITCWPWSVWLSPSTGVRMCCILLPSVSNSPQKRGCVRTALHIRRRRENAAKSTADLLYICHLVIQFGVYHSSCLLTNDKQLPCYLLREYLWAFALRFRMVPRGTIRNTLRHFHWSLADSTANQNYLMYALSYIGPS